MSTTKQLKIMREENSRVKIELKEKLINAIQSREPIWDRRLSSHKIKEVVEACFAEVAQEVNISVAECRKIWKSLRDHFRNLYHAVTMKKSGDGYDEETEFETVKWVFFKQLLFLRDVIERRDTTSNFIAEKESEIHEVEKSFTSEVPVKEITRPDDTLIFEEDEEYEVRGPDGQMYTISHPKSTSSHPKSTTSHPKSTTIFDTLSKSVASPASKASCNSKVEEIGKQKATEKLQNPSKKKKENENQNAAIFKELAKINKDMTEVDSIEPCRSFGTYAASILARIPLESRLEAEAQVIKYLMSKVKSTTENDSDLL